MTRMFGQIVACALMDRWRALAKHGDAEALERLLRLLPRDVPAAARISYRTAMIRRLAGVLREALPDASDHRIASLIAEAGKTLEIRTALGPAFSALPSEVRREVERLVHDALGWSEHRQGRGCWPGRKQVNRLIT